MPRAADPNRERAEKLYLESGGQLNLKDIADQLGISAGTVRGWKSKDRWDEKLNGTLQSKERNAPKHTERSKRDKVREQPPPAITVENEELTEKQRLFCLYYVKYFNATKAYKKAYACAYDTARSNGARLLANADIQSEINRLKEEHTRGVKLDVQFIIQKYIDIAFADITDFIRFGQREEQVIGQFGPVFADGEGDEKVPVMQTVNYIDFLESDDVDGTIISEVKQGKDGMSVKLSDRMRALKELEKYTGYLTDEDKLKLQKLRADVDKAEQEAKMLSKNTGKEPLKIEIDYGDDDDDDDGS